MDDGSDFSVAFGKTRDNLGLSGRHARQKGEDRMIKPNRISDLENSEELSALRRADGILWAAKKLGGDEDLLWAMHAYISERRAEVSR